MTIWLLAILLMAALGALGLRVGVVRVTLSFFGILFGALLASPLGHLFKPLVSLVGLKHPAWLALLPPCIGFLLVLTIFKIVGFVLNNKLENYYKYKAGDLQMALWERANHRLGLVLGLFNGAAYFILLSVAVYTLSYWTYQMATPDSDPKGVRLLNQMGADLQKTGMNHVAVSIDKMPPSFYQAGDIVGLIYHNPLLQARLSRYPAVLELSELPEFQDLANDKDFTELQMRQAPIIEIVNYPKVQAIIKNPDLVKTITNALTPNLADLQSFLETGKSRIFNEEILGRWDFDVPGTMILMRATHPGMSPVQAHSERAALSAEFTKATFVAAPPETAVIKGYPLVNRTTKPPTIELQNYKGTWSKSSDAYVVTLPIEGKDQQFIGELHGDRLALKSQTVNLGFIRED